MIHFELRHFLHAITTAFPTYTAVLNAAEWYVGFGVNGAIVDVPHTRLQALGELHGLLRIIGDYTR